MMNRYFLIFVMSMFLFNCTKSRERSTDLQQFNLKNWVCVYSDSAKPDDIKKFDLAVLDADAHPDLESLKNSRTLLFGYVSLAEVGSYRWYWRQISAQPWVLDKNPNWDSYMLDVRDKDCQKVVLKKIIPAILEQGFDGLFLDTIDTAEYLEKYHTKQKHPGSQAAMVKLIEKIRREFPEVYLIANRGFSMLNDFGWAVDGVVAESVLTEFNSEQQVLNFNSDNAHNATLDFLKNAKTQFNLEVFTLDYVGETGDFDTNQVTAKAREKGFIPYISTRNLNRIYFTETGE